MSNIYFKILFHDNTFYYLYCRRQVFVAKNKTIKKRNKIHFKLYKELI